MYENSEERIIREHQKAEYDKLRIEHLKFKKDKIGSTDLAGQLLRRQEKTLLSAVELKRMKFLQNKKEKVSETDAMAKIKDFRARMNSDRVKSDKWHWMNTKLKFHIDSANAFNFNEKKDKVDDRGVNAEFVTMKEAMVKRQYAGDEEAKGRSIEMSTQEILKMSGVGEGLGLGKEEYDP